MFILRVDVHSHGIHNDCEKILKKWMHFASGLKNDWLELETVLCAYDIILLLIVYIYVSSCFPNNM